MKKINKHFLADISLELSPLAEDNEGMLRGGFAGLGGMDIDALGNGTCSNTPCSHGVCSNGTCTNTECAHTKTCSNDNCINGTTTSSTTKKPNEGSFCNLLM